ncbi:MAG TPA: hypothetical protein VG838_00105 [Opitutaceae bacterium]|nr:hypothetical protein [Opitutaceae bacterium]
MTAKLLDFLKSGPPAPRVVLLPDHRFFVRVIPVAEGATAADVAAQVDLALETLSPFPPAQLYHGYYWVAGATQVLVFASYRKRFTPEQAADWKQAELVMPAFAAVLGLAHEPATTLLFPSADGLTAVYWESGPVPTTVLARNVPPDATDEERARIRDELLRSAGVSRVVVDLTAAPEIAVSPDEKNFLFRAGEFTAQLPVAATPSLDVRDKTELAAFRGDRLRDLWLWRGLAACVWLMFILGAGELALVGGRSFWLKTQNARINGQIQPVSRVMSANDFANRIEELSTKRLLPLEMVQAVGSKEKRGGILFTRIVSNTTNGVYNLQIDAQTSNSAELEVYRMSIEKLPSVASATIPKPQTRNGMTTFTLYITFKPEAVKPAT